ncbi:hypothetical protein CJ030_MR1G028876 [Morella rubra]|uniref:Phorbol-ester/DAG-type domain-containing protein n=1 Tax=Morella rubra TaxID=262757 RepID=A0A6A1WQD2_9ROSI|nr:hypothetical protein CJ030_MR1G028876 [Morella rubra]
MEVQHFCHKHPLILTEVVETDGEKGVICSGCDFDLDIKCASQSRIDTDNSHTSTCVHHFFKQIQFTCEACGEECKAWLAYVASVNFLVHTKCANFPSTIEIAAHNHSLAHTYSLRQVKELPDKVFCRLCYKKINPNYAAYYCQECDYVAHAVCTYKVYVFDGPLKKGKEAESGLEEINLKGDEEAGEIKHFSHQHNLVLNCEELKDEKLCEGCRLLISGPFYSCEQCSFFLHDNVLNCLQRKNTHFIHTSSPFSQGISAPSIVMLVVNIVLASATNVRTVAPSILTFSVAQFQKPLNMKVISIPSSLLYIPSKYAMVATAGTAVLYVLNAILPCVLHVRLFRS